MRVGGRAHGETPFQHLGRRIERQKKKKHKIHHGLRQPSINNGSHNNQPKKGQLQRREVWRGCATSGTRGGNEIPSFLGRCKLNNWYKLLKWLSLVTIFFGRFVLFSKTQPPRPWSTPSPEATGVGRLEMQKASMPLDRRPTPP
jgi:hypothetical protein